jgi:aminoglycoside phosphotransferase (APT) family kinase protein
MSQPWSPEVVLTSEEAKKRIEEQFPELKPVTIFEIGKGFDNTVFLVNEKYIFRFPRKEVAVQLQSIENQLLPLLVKQLSMKIPEPIYFGKATESFKWPFTGYHHVEGKVPGGLPDEIRHLSAKKLALFLRGVHQFPISQAESIGIPHDRFERMNISKRKEALIENIKKANVLHLMDEASIALEWLNSFETINLDSPLTLVHGDCHIRNIVVDDQGIISGVIDWGDTHLGHPAIDLSIAYSFLPASSRKEFYQVYGEVSEETKMAARFFALYVSVILLLYGHDLRDEDLVSSSKESIRLALN